MKQASIPERIRARYDTFSKSHRKIADYVLENMSEVAFLSINEASAKIGVSPATFTRFTRELALSGFSEFQRMVRSDVHKELLPFDKLKPILGKQAPAPDGEDGMLQWIISDSAHSLASLYTPQLNGAFQQTLDLVDNARHIYVAGLRSSYTAAYYLHFMLGRIYEHVYLLEPGTGDLSRELSYVSPQDCLITISYAQYTKATYQLAEQFHHLGCSIVAITDSQTNPIALKATQILLAPNSGQYSLVSAIALCNALFTILGRRHPETSLQNLSRQGRIAMDLDTYL